MQENSKIVKFLRAAWEYIKEARMELIVLAAAIIVDLVSKAIVDGNMYLGQSVTLIPKFLNITYIHNDAAAFGSSFGLDKLLGQQGVMVVFIVISFVAVIFFSYFMYRNRGKNKTCRVALALIIGGAVGNLVDRMVFGYVRDFIQFEYFGLKIFGSTSFAIFNIADAALCVGVAMFAVYYIFIYKEPKKEEKTEENAPEYSALDDDTESVPLEDNNAATEESARCGSDGSDNSADIEQPASENASASARDCDRDTENEDNV